MPREYLKKQAEIHKLLSDPTRIAIINLIVHRPGELSVSEIAKEVGTTQPTVSYHLDEIQSTHVLKSKRIKRKVYYSLNKSDEANMLRAILHSSNHPHPPLPSTILQDKVIVALGVLAAIYMILLAVVLWQVA